MTAALGLEERLLEFRDTFDHAFAVAPISSIETFEDFLAVRVAGDPYALRVREIAGLVASRKIVPLPSRRPELLGAAGIRGSLVVVYSLAAILGYPSDSSPPSWLALVGNASPVALGFEEFEGFVRAPAADVHAAPKEEGVRLHTRETVLVEKRLRRVVDLKSALETIELHPGVAGPPKES